ncbi:YceK/YidQ family lipoprotein [Shewanella salipaludis]|uniref:YceK/YidQ family lipoprotein n=1 Tax=Shewanella salipaludis TaxID=2723052 RepID=A0A972FWC0_9GAMM|nr:YceK/YidQ family lipoprotein [Shewanella salipaludis]NMH64468.1 YceK/YidQ family lipoprotein [Shewanella salipaludis]
MTLKQLLSLAPLMLLTACSTINTLSPEQEHIDIAYHGRKSYCDEIPRIYSGVAYNVCLVKGEPSQTTDLGSSFNGVPFFVIDTVFSAAADTLVLPYTLYQQARHGNIAVN